jgi:hypothetical protein
MPGPNQIDRKLEDFHTTPADLLQVPASEITEAALARTFPSVSVIWKRGSAALVASRCSI